MAFKISAAVITIITLFYYLKRKNKILSFLIGSVTGFLALVLLNRYGGYVDYIPPLNLFNISASIVLGIPYVITLFTINLIT